MLLGCREGAANANARKPAVIKEPALTTTFQRAGGNKVFAFNI